MFWFEAARICGRLGAQPSGKIDMIFKDMARLGSLGFTLVGCTFLGLGAGYALDRKLDCAPWFTIGLLIFGIGAGFFNIFNTLGRMKKPPQT